MSLVYFIKPVGMDGPIKIGCSNHPEGRLLTLAAWSPFPLEIVGSVPGSLSDEKFLHDCFLDLHSHHEWFRSSPELTAAIAKIIAAGTIDAVRPVLFPKGNSRDRWRRNWSPDRRECRSYTSRITWAQKRLRKSAGGDGAWHAPADIDEILARWGGHGRRTPMRPTDAELLRLQQFLADPAGHAVRPGWIDDHDDELEAA